MIATRAVIILRRYENGLEKCIGCSLCAAACPADAIWVEAAENTDEERYSPGERYAKTYEINMLRCIFCGYCEDACPTEAIQLGHEHQMSFTDRRDAIYTKDMLIDAPEEGAKTRRRRLKRAPLTGRYRIWKTRRSGGARNCLTSDWTRFPQHALRSEDTQEHIGFAILSRRRTIAPMGKSVDMQDPLIL